MFTRTWLLSAVGLLTLWACTPSPSTPAASADKPAAAPVATPTAPPAQGAAPATPSAASGTAPVAVSFKADVAPVLSRSCAGCHSAGGSAAGSWTAFDAAGQASHAGVTGQLARVISNVSTGRMPKGAAPKLSPAEVDTLKRWEAAGAPNN